MLRKLLKKIFKIHSPSKEWTNIRTEYVEKNTRCDKCKFLNECESVLDCTKMADTRKHYICMLGGECKLDEEIDKIVDFSEAIMGTEMTYQQRKLVEAVYNLPPGARIVFGRNGHIHFVGGNDADT